MKKSLKQKITIGITAAMLATPFGMNAAPQTAEAGFSVGSIIGGIAQGAIQTSKINKMVHYINDTEEGRNEFFEAMQDKYGVNTDWELNQRLDTIMANMTILERHSHNMTVSYVEPSQDAAVEYGADGKNLVFRNDTEHAIYIYTNVDRENATVTIYGTRPEYHYELASVIVEEKKSNRKRYEYDYDGKNVYYITDPPKLKTAGHGSCHSEGWLVAYDWDTKEEVSREQISYDVYTAGVNVYWRGVHDANGNVIDPNQPQEGEGE